MVSFVLKDGNGQDIAQYPQFPCFAPLWYLNKKTRDSIRCIHYFPEVLTSRAVAIKYLSELKKTKFKIAQSPEEILDDGFKLMVNDFTRKAGHISIPEVMGTLCVMRYLEEFPHLVGRFLNLIELDPEIDRWQALFSANYLASVSGSLPLSGGSHNGSHTLGNPFESIAPLKTWDEVEEGFEQTSTAWDGEFKGLQKFFGVLKGKIPTKIRITKKEDFEEFLSQCGK